MPRKTDEAKGREILKKREKARKGLRQDAPATAGEKMEERRRTVGDDALAVDLGLKR